MGEARRRRLTLIKSGKAEEAHQPAMKPPPANLTLLEILIPTPVAKAINELHELVVKHYPSRNDFLEDLLKAGLQTAVEAQREAVAQMQADALVQLATVIPEGMQDASARLRALRGEQP